MSVRIGAFKQCCECGGLRKVTAYRHRVDEEADQGLQLRVSAAVRRHPDDELLLTGVAVEEGLKRGKKHREQADFVLLSQALEASDEVLGDSEEVAAAAVGELGRSWEVAGKRQRLGGAGELAAPEVPQLLHDRSLQVLALASSKSGVLDWQLGQFGLPSLAVAGIEGLKLAEQHAH